MSRRRVWFTVLAAAVWLLLAAVAAAAVGGLEGFALVVFTPVSASLGGSCLDEFLPRR